MAHLQLDCQGMPCPQPVLRVKDALAQQHSPVEVLIDNEASYNNVLRFARSQGHQVDSTSRTGGIWTIAITPNPVAADHPLLKEDYVCEPSTPVNLIYVISSDSMGRGNEELGWALMQTYVQTIKDVSPMPTKILLYNGGVKLVTAASGALEALKDLQQGGIEILACGTCLDFFKLKSAIKVGQISNMYDIMRSMAEADKIVSPL